MQLRYKILIYIKQHVRGRACRTSVPNRSLYAFYVGVSQKFKFCLFLLVTQYFSNWYTKVFRISLTIARGDIYWPEHTNTNSTYVRTCRRKRGRGYDARREKRNEQRITQRGTYAYVRRATPPVSPIRPYVCFEEQKYAYIEQARVIGRTTVVLVQ